MSKVVTEELPHGWSFGTWEARQKQILLLPRRARVLLAAEWARSVLHHFEGRYPGDNRPRLAIEAAEKWTLAPTAADADARAAAADAAARAAARAADAADARWRWIYDTYRHARGPAGLSFDPQWRTSTAVSLARGIVTDRAFDLMPILADAMQDAGCSSSELFTHLQQDHGEFTLADWCLWNLLQLDKESL